MLKLVSSPVVSCWAHGTVPCATHRGLSLGKSCPSSGRRVCLTENTSLKSWRQEQEIEGCSVHINPTSILCLSRDLKAEPGKLWNNSLPPSAAVPVHNPLEEAQERLNTVVWQPTGNVSSKCFYSILAILASSLSNVPQWKCGYL